LDWLGAGATAPPHRRLGSDPTKRRRTTEVPIDWSHDQAATTTSSITYSGAPLEPGMTYQLRILAIKETLPVPVGFTQLSQIEDVAGVFTYQP
jgi:hypothetical protein